MALLFSCEASTECQRSDKLDETKFGSAHELVGLISAIPDTVLAAITAALITLLGVHLQNRSNSKQLEKRLDQEKEEKSTQRRIELRREVYLKFEQELIAMQSLLGQFPKLIKGDQVSLETVNSFSASAGQVQLISEPETAELTAELATQIGEAYLEGVRAMIPFVQLDSEIAGLEQYLTIAQSESKRLLLELTTWHERINQKHEEYDRLNNSFQFWNEKAKENINEKQKLMGLRTRLEIKHSQWLAGKLQETVETTARLRSKLRQELEFGDAGPELQQLAEQNAQRIINKLNELNEAAKKELDRSEPS